MYDIRLTISPLKQTISRDFIVQKGDFSNVVLCYYYNYVIIIGEVFGLEV